VVYPKKLVNYKNNPVNAIVRGVIILKKILVVFGSKSDSAVYEEIKKQLDKLGLSYDLRICSAHRTPELLDEILEEDFALIIAGAGLAAHLPGVVASKTVRPVIGVPIDSNYKGLDALLSIMQMPPGVPVISVGVGNALEAANSAKKMLKEHDKVTIIGDAKHKRVKKCIETLSKLDIKHEIKDAPDKETINIKFIQLDEIPETAEELIIYCPVVEKHEVGDALNILKNSKNGLWVGLNRGENAALAAAEIITIYSEDTNVLKKYREEMKKKVFEHDKKERVKKKHS